MLAFSLLLGDLSFARFSAVPLKEKMHSIINGGRRERKERNELTRNGNVKCSSELVNIKYITEEKRFQNHAICNLYNVIHIYDQIRRNKGNLRRSLFEEGAPDVGQGHPLPNCDL